MRRQYDGDDVRGQAPAYDLEPTRRIERQDYEPLAVDRVDRVETVTADADADRSDLAHRLVQATYLIFGVIEALIAIRFILRLLGANPAASFSSFIYDVTGPLVAPFRGMFGTAMSGRSVLEPESIVALIVYALVAWLIAAVIRLALDGRRGATYQRSTRTRME